MNGIVAATQTPNAYQLSGEECEQRLRAIWRDEYESNAAIFATVLRQEEARRPGVLAALAAAGLESDPWLISK